jgi:hypothetical protein
MMHTLIDQLELSLTSKQYLLSLYVALTIPDIAGALSSEDGTAKGSKYAAWFEEWVHPQRTETVLAKIRPEYRADFGPTQNPLSGEECYRFRCSLLHRGSTQHDKSPFARIIFIEPGAADAVVTGQVEDALCIDLDLFCREMISAARLWLKATKEDPNYLKNYERFIQRHEGGLAPYIIGVPVIG